MFFFGTRCRININIRLRCTGSTEAGLQYQLSDPDDRSYYFGVNKQRDTVVNPCLNSTYRFVELIIQHLISLHKVTSYCCALHGLVNSASQSSRSVDQSINQWKRLFKQNCLNNFGLVAVMTKSGTKFSRSGERKPETLDNQWLTVGQTARPVSRS